LLLLRGLLLRAADAGGDVVAGDDAVADGDDAMGVLGDVGLMGDEDNRVAVRVELVEEGHDLVAGLGVEVSGGLVARMMEGLFTRARAMATRWR
jgi:hypothetical protein